MACAQAGAQGAFLNVVINLQEIKDENFNKEIKGKASQLKKEAYDLASQIEKYMNKELNV